MKIFILTLSFFIAANPAQALASCAYGCGYYYKDRTGKEVTFASKQGYVCVDTEARVYQECKELHQEYQKKYPHLRIFMFTNFPGGCACH